VGDNAAGKQCKLSVTETLCHNEYMVHLGRLIAPYIDCECSWPREAPASKPRVHLCVPEVVNPPKAEAIHIDVQSQQKVN
jgi:hypothetical protein